MKGGKVIKELLTNEKSVGVLLILCTLVSLLLTNSTLGDSYLFIWDFHLGDSLSFVHLINDGLMAIFFLLIGLELKHEVHEGELSEVRKAMLPFFGAIGGIVFPALIFLAFNFGTYTQAGAGIPMATDIVFAIGILSLLGKRVPTALKIFLTALAVIDDLGAIIVIAVFYTTELVWLNLGIALLIFAILLLLNRLKINWLPVYLAGGILLWYFLLHSGVHASLAGVLVSLTIPSFKKNGKSISGILQRGLHNVVNYIILPLFALANTCIIIDDHWTEALLETNSLGILLGLIIGKPLGIALFSFVSVYSGLCSLPKGVSWKHIIGIGMLGGIGFTMSIFISQLAYTNDSVLINTSKLMILIASLLSGIFGLVWLKFCRQNL